MTLNSSNAGSAAFECRETGLPSVFHYHGSSGSVSACSWVVTSLPSWPLVTFSVSFSRRSSK